MRRADRKRLADELTAIAAKLEAAPKEAERIAAKNLEAMPEGNDKAYASQVFQAMWLAGECSQFAHAIRLIVQYDITPKTERT